FIRRSTDETAWDHLQQSAQALDLGAPVDFCALFVRRQGDVRFDFAAAADALAFLREFERGRLLTAEHFDGDVEAAAHKREAWMDRADGSVARCPFMGRAVGDALHQKSG